MSLIPKIVWTYYHDFNVLPEFYRNCLRTWESNIPKSWQVFVLDETVVSKFINMSNMPKNFNKLIPQRKSDCIRLELLSTYGGVWMDVGTILNDNLEKLIPMNPNTEYVGYYLSIFLPPEPHENITNAVVENWFIATTPNFLIKTWREKFFEILDNYDESTIHLSYPYKDQSTLKQIQNFLYKHYLLMHVLYQYLLIHDTEFKRFHTTKTFLRPAEDTALSVQSNAGWKSSKIKKFYDNYFTKRGTSEQPLLKARGVDFSHQKNDLRVWVIILAVVIISLLILLPLPLIVSVKKIRLG
jgi:hypothetical protein